MAGATLTEDVRAFLRAPRFGVLATIDRDGMPQQTTMWYELDGDEILMNTAAGRLKVRNLRRDPRVSLCVEDGYNYVTLVGEVTLNDEQETAQADIARLARRYHPPQKADQLIREQFRNERRVTIRMRIARVSAHL